eukprot:77389-Chlamydomonas_euryale.AAC.1
MVVYHALDARRTTTSTTVVAEGGQDRASADEDVDEWSRHCCGHKLELAGEGRDPHVHTHAQVSRSLASNVPSHSLASN